MTDQEAIKLLKESGFNSNANSLDKLIESGRVLSTGSRQQADLNIDEESLKKYIEKYREFMNGNDVDFMRRHTVL
ncbi:hypothetical protein AZI11_00200 [Levilactobacillus brevis]|uniref:hypothetical protein n=1 Tax=Levilactobacillus brevis TaxID=1580 RepID=UPI000A2072B3|nr:hypothetical protein [Levilactobacillus brevis]ARN91437.1 hypothetical protein AZI11_00200 [Levilactobacillus brevis]ARN94180.1 hypothetical protein AZI12_00200 [Levilactobacillus brevis]